MYTGIYIQTDTLYIIDTKFSYFWYLHVSAVWLFTFLPIYLHNLQYLVVRHNICLRMYVFTPCYRIEPGKLEPKEPLNGSCSKGSQISTYRERSLNLLEN